VNEPRHPHNVFVLDVDENIWVHKVAYEPGVPYEQRSTYWMPYTGVFLKYSWKKLQRKFGPLAVFRLEE
jgi:hypothetical protein